jgi:tetratricopeptide (TPR) repeat protein
MSHIAKVTKQRPAKKRGFRISSSVLQWGVVAIVAGFMMFFLVRSVTSRPEDTPPTPLLGTAQPDLISLTRTTSDLQLDSQTRAAFAPEVSARLARADSLAAANRWPEVSEYLRGLLRTTKSGGTASVRAYLGYCYYRSASPDYALAQFRKSFAVADSALPGLQPWLAFAIGYLFQSRGFADSAAAWYERAADSPSDADSAFIAAAANNLGVVRELLGDSAAAALMYARAGTAGGSALDGRAARIIAENAARVARHAPPTP